MNNFLKVTLLGFIVSTVLVGCNSENKTQITEQNEIQLVDEEVAPVVYDSTMFIGSVKVGFTSLPVPIYYGYDTTYHHVDYEKKMLKKFPDLRREGLNLIFQSKTGIRKVFKDYPYNEEQTNYDPIIESVEYIFNGEVQNSNWYQINAFCYEYWYAFVLNKASGDTLRLIGDASFSSHGTWMLSYNFDLGAEYTPNGVELFQKEGSRYQKIGMKLLERWGVTDAKWINDSVVRLRKASYDKDWNQRFTYVNMTIIE